MAKTKKDIGGRKQTKAAGQRNKQKKKSEVKQLCVVNCA